MNLMLSGSLLKLSNRLRESGREGGRERARERERERDSSGTLPEIYVGWGGGRQRVYLEHYLIMGGSHCIAIILCWSLVVTGLGFRV